MNSPHRALGRRTPHEVYTTGPKAEPNDKPEEEWRVRNDVVTPNGKVIVHYATTKNLIGRKANHP